MTTIDPRLFPYTARELYTRPWPELESWDDWLECAQTSKHLDQILHHLNTALGGRRYRDPRAIHYLIDVADPGTGWYSSDAHKAVCHTQNEWLCPHLRIRACAAQVIALGYLKPRENDDCRHLAPSWFWALKADPTLLPKLLSYLNEEYWSGVKGEGKEAACDKALREFLKGCAGFDGFSSRYPNSRDALAEMLRVHRVLFYRLLINRECADLINDPPAEVYEAMCIIALSKPYEGTPAAPNLEVAAAQAHSVTGTAAKMAIIARAKVIGQRQLDEAKAKEEIIATYRRAMQKLNELVAMGDGASPRAVANQRRETWDLHDKAIAAGVIEAELTTPT